jgi:hypothetical protein
MAFGLYDIRDKHILEHGYGSVRGAFSSKDTYGNNQNIYVFEYTNGVVVNTPHAFHKKHGDNIQAELKSRGIR